MCFHASAMAVCVSHDGDCCGYHQARDAWRLAGMVVKCGEVVDKGCHWWVMGCVCTSWPSKYRGSAGTWLGPWSHLDHAPRHREHVAWGYCGIQVGEGGEGARGCKWVSGKAIEGDLGGELAWDIKEPWGSKAGELTRL